MAVNQHQDLSEYLGEHVNSVDHNFVNGLNDKLAWYKKSCARNMDQEVSDEYVTEVVDAIEAFIRSEMLRMQNTNQSPECVDEVCKVIEILVRKNIGYDINLKYFIAPLKQVAIEAWVQKTIIPNTSKDVRQEIDAIMQKDWNLAMSRLSPGVRSRIDFYCKNHPSFIETFKHSRMPASKFQDSRTDTSLNVDKIFNEMERNNVLASFDAYLTLYCTKEERRHFWCTAWVIS